jgi:hypothetical protein
MFLGFLLFILFVRTVLAEVVAAETSLEKI